MANAVEARWHGDNYQSRFFWIHAASLLDPERPEVVEVTFEADGPKAFDDVVVRYEPGRPRASGPGRITVDYHQIKWHVDRKGTFGFKDLTEPKFIGAESVSILQRLQQAKRDAPAEAAFHLITTDALAEGDQLGELISPIDSSLRLHKLQEGKTDRSRMGEVRQCWREHLGLSSDEELYAALDGLHIQASHPDLDFMRKQVSLNFRLVGLVGAEDATTFHYDDAARQLKIKGISRMDRAGFDDWCRSEGWYLPARPPERASISIQTFQPGAVPANMQEAPADRTLDLTDRFDGRHLRLGVSWSDLQRPIADFLERMLAARPGLRLFLDAHSSVAFLAGATLRFKTGADVETVQKGMGNPGRVWNAGEGDDGPPPDISVEKVGDGRGVALAVGLARDPIQQVREHVAAHLPEVGTIIRVVPADGVGQDAVRSGRHAASIAAAISAAVAAVRQPGGTVHAFVAGPNAFSFLLGQHAEAMGECIPYEYDFGSRVDGYYRPTFRI